jgi:Family of unknown function (DUF6491)
MRLVLAMACSAALVAACGTTPTETAEAPAEPDVRQGKEVSSICFLSQVRNWRPLDRDSLIIEKTRRQEYRVVVDGTCDPRDAFMSIGLSSRASGGSCLTRGDKLITDARPNFGPCFVRSMYEWNEDAAKPAAPAEAETSGAS